MPGITESAVDQYMLNILPPRDSVLQEMEAQTELIDELALMVGEGKKITLLCSSACVDAAHCHRALLADLIEKRQE